MPNSEFERRKAASQLELENLLSRGLVEPVLLFPSIFGGTDDARNTSWLPPACLAEKEQFEQQVKRAIQNSREPVNYCATPIYDGDSMVPIEIKLTAGNATIQLHHVIDTRRYRNW